MPMPLLIAGFQAVEDGHKIQYKTKGARWEELSVDGVGTVSYDPADPSTKDFVVDWEQSDMLEELDSLDKFSKACAANKKDKEEL